VCESDQVLYARPLNYATQTLSDLPHYAVNTWKTEVNQGRRNLPAGRTKLGGTTSKKGLPERYDSADLLLPFRTDALIARLGTTSTHAGKTAASLTLGALVLHEIGGRVTAVATRICCPVSHDDLLLSSVLRPGECVVLEFLDAGQLGGIRVPGLTADCRRPRTSEQLTIECEILTAVAARKSRTRNQR